MLDILVDAINPKTLTAVFAAIAAVAAGRSVYAAGGVRDAADLAELKRRGIAGALVATSLHDGRLRGSDIAGL